MSDSIRLTNSLSQFLEQNEATLSPEIVEKAIIRTQAVARLIYRNPELGTEEVQTSDILSRELAKVIGEENVYILVKQNIGTPRVEEGILFRPFTPIWGRPHMSTRSQGGFKNFITEDSEMGGIVGILDGDNPEGLTIAVFCDLDALNNGHHCGHNAHCAGLLADALLLKEYQKLGGTINAQRIVFIGRVNEEGLNPKKQFSDAKEMVDAGLLDIIGSKPDVILSSHVLPSLPLGEVIIDKGSTTHAAGFFSVAIDPVDAPKVPPEVVLARIIKKISEEWQSETIDKAIPSLNRTGTHRFNKLVRISDSGLITERRDSSSRKTQKQISIGILPGQEERIVNYMYDIEDYLNGWSRVVGVNYEWSLIDNQFYLSINASGGHIAESGPNVEYLASVIITYLDEQGIEWYSEAKSLNLVGTVRLKNKEWQRIGNRIIEDIHGIANTETDKTGYKGDVRGAVVVPPVINSPRLRLIAQRMIKNSALSEYIREGEERLTAGYAEPFSFWQKVLQAESLLIWVGIGEIGEVQNNRSPVLNKMQLHNENMITPLTAVPYLGIMGVLALEITKTT